MVCVRPKLNSQQLEVKWGNNGICEAKIKLTTIGGKVGI